MTFLRRVSRDAYLISRTAGDLNAAQRGRLGKRVVKRVYHRSLIRLLRKGRVW